MKRVFHIFSQVLSWLLVAVTAIFMVFTILTVRTQGADRSIFGVRMLVVLSNSMSATDFSAGDMIFIREVDPATLQVGDVISHISTAEDSYGSMITHKISRIRQEAGELSFVTYGTTTGYEDPIPASSQNVQGKYIGRIPKVGLIIQALKNNPIYLVVLVFAILALYILSGVLRALLEKRNQELTPTQIETRNPTPGELPEAPGENPQGGVQTEDEEE